ncbi:MAG: hypothetical protein K0R97_2324 [Oerskovia sp.]|jgi:hypothetical protein|nr:hypothetical protein [Oerskovia sp.]
MPHRRPARPLRTGASLALAEGDRATFTDDQGHEEVFEVREGATEAIDLCS